MNWCWLPHLVYASVVMHHKQCVKFPEEKVEIMQHEGTNKGILTLADSQCIASIRGRTKNSWDNFEEEKTKGISLPDLKWHSLSFPYQNSWDNFEEKKTKGISLPDLNDIACHCKAMLKLTFNRNMQTK